MHYKGKVIGITGFDGFLGRHLFNALRFHGASVIPIQGDVRDQWTFKDVGQHMDYLFHFGAPSSQVLFKKNPTFCAESTILGFINASRACRKYGVRLIYPSTGLLSSEHTNEYARCKKVCEQIHLDEHLDAIGFRIFGTYGPGEGHKRDYASVPYLFARDIMSGRQPVVYGDGTQSRDFIFVEDTIGAVLRVAEYGGEQIIDVGSGVNHSFLELVDAINAALGTNMEPLYMTRPGGYVQETHADITKLEQYYKPKVDLAEGVGRMIDSMKPARMSK